MGDFFETFDEDAKHASEVLGIALTSRPMGKAEGRIPLAGIPYHALQRYLDQLVAAGHRVAIAEQVAPPGHGLVERRVVRVVTPGTVDEGALLQESANNWLVAVAPAAEDRWGLAACDVTTGELELQLVDSEALPAEWERLRPREVLFPSEGEVAGRLALPEAGMAGREAPLRTPRPAREFHAQRATEALAEHYGVASLDGFGLERQGAAVGASGALLAYLQESWPAAVAQLRVPRAVRTEEHVYLDARTRRNLDLFVRAQATIGEGAGGSLLETIDRTLTPMGGRLLRARLGRPLRDAQAARARLDEVQAWHEAPLERGALRQALRGLGDLERLLGRVRAGTATARHLVQLRAGLDRLPAVTERACAVGGPAAASTGDLAAAAEPAALIAAAIVEEPPSEPGEGETLRRGFDPLVDELRDLAHDGRSALAVLEAAERERSGIGSLRVGYHRVFGYYLEIPRSQAERAPADYEPRQTLAQTQRYRCAPLTELESRILSARERLLEAERAALERVCAQVAAAGAAIERAASAIARIDVAAALAEVAADHGYVRPQLHTHGGIRIEGGRHPVVERHLPRGAFVPNDCALGSSPFDAARADGPASAGRVDGDGGVDAEVDAAADVIVLTGPNMGGKSTYLRQNALIALLAQCGSFVPAEQARIGMVDRICSRVGAQDEIAAGRSTFMVEMLETADILHNATERSLVVLDEIGRGTSTDDGLAIARAVVEALHHRPAGSPLTLFATHYHELTALAGLLPRVANRSVAVADEGREVVFLHRIVDGGADRSYGVHVAALAGLPRAVIARARELLLALERDRAGDGEAVAWNVTAPEGQQLPLHAPAAHVSDMLLEELAALEPDDLSPLEALQRLYELRAEARARLGVEG